MLVTQKCCSLFLLGIVFDTREGYEGVLLPMPGIVFDTREGCETARSVLGIVFDTRDCGVEFARRAWVRFFVPVRGVGFSCDVGDVTSLCIGIVFDTHKDSDVSSPLCAGYCFRYPD